MLVSMINAMEVREDDEDFKNPVDLMFEALEEREPEHFAVRQYKKYKLAAGVISYKRHLKERMFNQIVAFFIGRRALNDRSVVCCPV